LWRSSKSGKGGGYGGSAKSGKSGGGSAKSSKSGSGGSAKSGKSTNPPTGRCGKSGGCGGGYGGYGSMKPDSAGIQENQPIILQLDDENVEQLLKDLVAAGRISENMTVNEVIAEFSDDEVITRKLKNILGNNGRALVEEAAEYETLKVRDVISGKAGRFDRL